MLRTATIEDAVALRDLERTANLAALGHVFDPQRYPFPEDDVLARWVLVLAEPGVTVLVRDAADGLDLLVAHDDTTLRHLVVRPDRWREGLGSRLVETATRAMVERGARSAELWCLAANHGARRLYESLGWRAAAERREAPWPPYPTEMRYTRTLEGADA